MAHFGVLGEGRLPIGTGDGDFGADRGQLAAFVSVAKFGGPVSLPIRLIGNTGSSNSLRSPSPVPALLAELASQPLRAVQSWDRASRQSRNGRCRIHAGRSTGPRVGEGFRRLAEALRRRPGSPSGTLGDVGGLSLYHVEWLTRRR